MQARAQAKGPRKGRTAGKSPRKQAEPDGRGREAPGAHALRAVGYVRVSQERNLRDRYGRVKASQGGWTGTWLPYGYKAVDGEVAVVEEEAAVVRKVFKWKASGRSLRWMAEKLNADGVPTQHRRKWYPSTVWDLYRNRFYTGRSEFDGA